MLDKRGVTKCTVVDVSLRFLAHKYVQEKLFDDFTQGDSVSIEILDRTRQAPGLVQIHASKIWLRKSSLTPAQFQKLLREEDEAMTRYKKP